uniref:Uncharacterized protein n=1 Tax=viral metagenome TaxID=1070528 RepID=A0A6C0ADQ2_9ZZZZ
MKKYLKKFQVSSKKLILYQISLMILLKMKLNSLIFQI